MNIDTENIEIPEKALELLPWFLTGQLSPEDNAYFEEVLQSNSALKALVEKERSIFNLLVEDKMLIGLSTLASPESRLENVFKQIDNTAIESPSGKFVEVDQSLFDKIKSTLSSWLPSSFGTVEYARFASVALLVVSLSVLMAFVVPIFSEKNEFIPAASETAKVINSQSTTILVGTNGSMDSLQTHPLLKGKLSKVQSISGKKGMYQISFNKKLSNAQVKEVLSSLSSNKELIWFAGEAY